MEVENLKQKECWNIVQYEELYETRRRKNDYRRTLEVTEDGKVIAGLKSMFISAENRHDSIVQKLNDLVYYFN